VFGDPIRLASQPEISSPTNSHILLISNICISSADKRCMDNEPTPPEAAPRRLDSRRPMNLLTVTEVAAMLRVSKMTIYRMVHAGRLPSLRVGQSYRIPAEAAAALFGVPMQNQAG
jgi:excisionase family DNA binding protein